MTGPILADDPAVEESARRADGALEARILLVDDEPAIRRSLSRLLVAAGHRITTASDGREALAQIGSTAFDVIVSDLGMPNIDGLTLLREIPGQDLDVPVVFLTGSPSLDTAVEALEYGAFRYLLKPVDEMELTDTVQRAARFHRLAKVRREAAIEFPGKLIGDRAGLEARYASAVEKLSSRRSRRGSDPLKVRKPAGQDICNTRHR